MHALKLMKGFLIVNFKSLLLQEILDGQFIQLEQLEDRDNPNFVEDVLTLYFRDSTTLLATVEQAMLVEWFRTFNLFPSRYFPFGSLISPYFLVMMMKVIINRVGFFYLYRETIPIDFPKVDKILHQLKGSSAR